MIHWTRIVENGAISFIWAIVKRRGNRVPVDGRVAEYRDAIYRVLHKTRYIAFRTDAAASPQT